MTEQETTARVWRIGELADAAGLSVRTLRYYEQAGLLSPSGRTDGGHRIYDELQVERLYRIRTLKSLGMTLQEIGEILDEGSLSEVLQQQLDRVDQEVRRLRQLRDRLRRLMAYVEDPIPTKRLIALLEAMSHLERELSPRQLDRIAKRRSELGTEGARAVEEDWRELAKLLRAEFDSGAAPHTGIVQAIARRAKELQDGFTGGEAAVSGALNRLRDHLPPEGLAGWDAELLDYLDAAFAVEPDA